MIRSFKFVISLFILLTCLTTNAQSFKGKLHSDKGWVLPYANLDLYQDGLLSASLLTDASGSFSVQLDSGLYLCIVQYASHETDSFEIEINKDVYRELTLKSNKDLIVKETAAAEKSVKTHSGADSDRETRTSSHSSGDHSEEMYERAGREMSYSFALKALPIKPMRPSMGIESGKLTAGELNDFAKWELWKDISQTELQQYKQNWKIELQERYTVQVVNQNGLPQANLKLILFDKNQFLFEARTDNAGRAELWSRLDSGASTDHKNLGIELYVDGSKERLNHPKTSENGVNHFRIERECNWQNSVDVAFVVDATGSMGDELEFLKAELNEMVFRSKSIDSRLQFRFANVFYRDVGDEYLTSNMDFTTVLSESVNFINTHTANGGGDYEEAVEVALDTAINSLSWSENSRTRILFLVLDAPPHGSAEVVAKFQKLLRSAAAKGIRIVPMVASGINKSAEYLFRSLALGTNGTYVFLTDHSGIGNEHLKPSTDDYKVELLSDVLMRIMVSFSYMPDCKQEIPEIPWEIGEDSITAVQVSSDTMENGDSVKHDTIQISWKYFPNPTNGLVHVEASHHISELHLTDLNGKLLKRITDIHPEERVQIDLSEFSSGIYMLRLPVGKQWVSGKIILVH